MTDEALGRTPALQQVLGSPLYRGSTIALFLTGVGASAAAPQIVLFMSRELGASLPLAGLYYLTSMAGPIAGYLVGRYSDRTGNRLNLFRLCAFAGFVGWALMALSTAVWLPFVVGAVILGFSGATFSQLFAAVHDEQVARPGDQNDSFVAISAIFMSSTALSSALGGVAGGLGVAVLGLPHVFFIPAACSFAAVLGLAVMARTFKFT